MTAPKWAADLLAQVVEDYGIPIDMAWRRSRGSRLSSGVAGSRGPGTLTVTGGRGRTDARLVLLHEIAHCLVPEHGHDRAFYEQAWELFDRYAPNVPRKVILQSEGDYMVMALKVAEERGVRGAKVAIARRRRPRNG